MFDVAFFDGLVNYGNANRQEIANLTERLKQVGQSFTQQKAEKEKLAEELKVKDLQIAERDEKIAAIQTDSNGKTELIKALDEKVALQAEKIKRLEKIENDAIAHELSGELTE